MDIESMKITEIWRLLEEKATDNQEAIKDMKTNTYGFKISGDEAGEYTLDFDNGNVEVSESLKDNTDCTLKLSDKNFKKLVNGNLNATSAFMMGKVKVEGNIGLALKLEKLLKTIF